MKKIKTLLLTSLVLLLTSCGVRTERVGLENGELTTTCIDGVQYFLFIKYGDGSYKGFGFMSPRYKKDGTIYTCDNIEVSDVN